MRKQRAIPQKPWMGVMGLLGCLGFTYFSTGQTYTLVYFAFFAFFSYFWWGKMGGQVPDERMLENQHKAARQAFSGGFAVIFVGTIFIGNAFGETNVHTAYALTVALVALGFAVAQNLSAFLTYYYDQKG